MNWLDTVEHTCAHVVEGAFARAFPTPLAPVQIARRLVAVFDHVACDRTAVEVLVMVGSRDALALAEDRSYLENRWNALFAELGAERGMGDLPPIRLKVDAALARGSVRIDIHRNPEHAVRRPIALAIHSGLPLDGSVGLDAADERDVIVGRENACDLVVIDPLVSRRHLALRREESKLRFRDLDSANGVFLKGRREREGVLNVGDVMRIGATDLVVRGD
ncbi:MAG TPA: FhaA domain-containing protein [Candidatus Baltobacteraceae bacterium]|jgi:hypothetical protein|nr:FhaA domain-containing protein [Candidatus Baltobacteraceae bacterium]